jgi:hypothetical protein
MCLGMNLAMMEMKTVVVKTLRKFHFELSPGQNVTYLHSLTLPNKDGLRVRVQRLSLLQPTGCKLLKCENPVTMCSCLCHVTFNFPHNDMSLE